MTTLAPDTSAEAERVLIDLARRMPPWRKLALVGEMNRTVRALALAGLRQRYPQAMPDELRHRLALLVLGPELATRTYGALAED